MSQGGSPVGLPEARHPAAGGALGIGDRRRLARRVGRGVEPRQDAARVGVELRLRRRPAPGSRGCRRSCRRCCLQPVDQRLSPRPAYGTLIGTTAEKRVGAAAAQCHVTSAPQSWPTTTAVFSPSASSRPSTSRQVVDVVVLDRGGRRSCRSRAGRARPRGSRPRRAPGADDATSTRTPASRGAKDDERALAHLGDTHPDAVRLDEPQGRFVRVGGGCGCGGRGRGRRRFRGRARARGSEHDDDKGDYEDPTRRSSVEHDGLLFRS